MEINEKNYELAEDLSVVENPNNPEEIIIYSLAEDKYIFITSEYRRPIEYVLSALKRYDGFAEIERQLRGQGWSLDVKDFVLLLYGKRMMKIDNALIDNKTQSALRYKTNDETYAFSKKLISWDVKKNVISVKLAKKMLTFSYFIFPLAAVALIASICLFPSKLFLLYKNYQRLKGFNSLSSSTLIIFVVILFSMISHEFGHIIVARRYGLLLKSVQWRIYRKIQSMFIVQIPGIPVLGRKSQAIISLAGPFANLLVGMVSCALFLLSPVKGQLPIILSSMGICNILIAISNLNPLLPSDGYKYLSITFFQNSDIKSKVIAKIRASGIMSLGARELVYLVAYFVGIGMMLVFSYSLIWMALKYLLPMIDGKVLPFFQIALSAIYTLATLNRLIKYFGGSEK